jgi:hypothetical protein
MNEDEEYSLEEEYYTDWFSDNKRDLRTEFCLEHEDEFNDYCKKQFNDWGDTRNE